MSHPPHLVAVNPTPTPAPLSPPPPRLQAAARQDATLALMKELPALLRKVQTDPVQAAALVGAVPEMQLEVYALKRQEKAFSQLAACVKDTFLKHADPQVGRRGSRQGAGGGGGEGQASAGTGQAGGWEASGRGAKAAAGRPAARPPSFWEPGGQPVRPGWSLPASFLPLRCLPAQVARECVAALATCAASGPDSIKDAASLALSECAADVAAGLAAAVGALERAGQRKVRAAAEAFERSGGEEEGQLLYDARAPLVRLHALLALAGASVAEEDEVHDALHELLEVGGVGLRVWCVCLSVWVECGASGACWRHGCHRRRARVWWRAGRRLCAPSCCCHLAARPTLPTPPSYPAPRAAERGQRWCPARAHRARLAAQPAAAADVAPAPAGPRLPAAGGAAGAGPRPRRLCHPAGKHRRVQRQPGGEGRGGRARRLAANHL